MLFKRLTHQNHVACSVEPLNFFCFQYGTIKLTLLKSLIHHTYVVYTIDQILLRCLQYEAI